MFKDILTYILGRVLGYNYSCDRCLSLGIPQMTIGIMDYIRNRNQNGRYCKWCWNWINLKKWKCECGNNCTLRSSHQSLITCMKCYNLVKLK